ncbi:HNH endonuclease [Deinococcus psychrotolerans]|uniref:HNH endonuclease n=1 Tax=Deinococcus psychrotolerans TaxID=2489213 RepID=UPI0013DE4704|nr:HNH endonuclease [Deinococcus psychrotolerans]
MSSDDPLGQYFTKEHIFPAGIGGTWVKNDLICKKCNSEFGSSIDVAIQEALKPISIVLNVKNSRTSRYPIFDFESNGEKYRVIAEQAQITNLRFERPILSEDGKFISASGPKGSESHIDKSLTGFAIKLGWDLKNLIKGIPLTEIEIAPLVPIDIDLDISKKDIRLSLVKIAYLSLLSLGTQSQLSAINLDFVRSKLFNGDASDVEIVLTPDGTRFLNDNAHATFVHVLNAYTIGVQLFFYGAITVLIKFPSHIDKVLEPFAKGVIIFPKTGELIETDNPNFILGDANPEIGYAALKQMMQMAIAKGEFLAMLRRAWFNAELNTVGSFYLL